MAPPLTIKRIPNIGQIHLMDGEEFDRIITRFNLSQIAAAYFLGADPRTVRKWIAGDLIIPQPVAALLRLMRAKHISPYHAARAARIIWPKE
jgi:DNA-binding transcriptional regulator YiaG